jgi:hypothetical protein
MAGLDANLLDLCKNPPLDSSLLANSWKKFPVKWFEYVQIHSMNALEKSFDQDFMIVATVCYVITLGIGIIDL